MPSKPKTPFELIASGLRKLLNVAAGDQIETDYPSSTCLSEVNYDKGNHQLIVQFRDSGSRYVYYGVDQSTYEELISANSVGQYFVADVRNSGYDYSRMS